MILEDQLTKFRESWNSIKVTVYDDKLLYDVAWGWGGRAVRKANSLIESLGLNLIAETSSEKSGFFTVKNKSNET